MRKLIKVRLRHIRGGEPKSSGFCPVALAIRDAGISVFFVCAGEISYGYPKHVNATPPRSVKRFIRRFDDRKPVKPFNFFLEEK